MDIKKFYKNNQWTIIAAIIVVLAVCITNNQGSRTGIVYSRTMVNPSSAYCGLLGYSSETLSDAAGQYSNCIFPDGTKCEEWQFYRGLCGNSHSYCALHGGTLLPAGNVSGWVNGAWCKLINGSYCEEGINSGVIIGGCQKICPTLVACLHKGNVFQVYTGCDVGDAISQGWELVSNSVPIDKCTTSACVSDNDCPTIMVDSNDCGIFQKTTQISIQQICVNNACETPVAARPPCVQYYKWIILGGIVVVIILFMFIRKKR